MKSPVDSPKTETRSADSPESLAALRRFARPRPNVERCELCSIEIGNEHPHLLDCVTRNIACSCEACAILFCGQERAKFIRIPKRILKIESFQFSQNEWDAMMLPIHLAFFLRRHDNHTNAFYPSPAGAMESMINLPTWDVLTHSDPTLAAIESDVEALLVNRIGDRNACFLVPIDAGYRLIGIIRAKWRGLSGGPEVWQAIANFFDSLERQATVIGEVIHA